MSIISGNNAPLQEQIKHLQSIFSPLHSKSEVDEATRSSINKAWDEAWERNATPWDQGNRLPPLQQLLSRPDVPIPKSGTALVPGCGRGYDVASLAEYSSAIDAIGIDISPIAVEKANEWLKSLPTQLPNARVELLDFFTHTPPNDGYDIIYDYTFFVALPPTLRPRWGSAMTRLTRPGGIAITLVWPIAPGRTEGPPYSTSIENVRSVLKEEDWDLIVDEVPPNLKGPMEGTTKIAIWKRKATPAPATL